MLLDLLPVLVAYVLVLWFLLVLRYRLGAWVASDVTHWPKCRRLSRRYPFPTKRSDYPLYQAEEEAEPEAASTPDHPTNDIETWLHTLHSDAPKALQGTNDPSRRVTRSVSAQS